MKSSVSKRPPVLDSKAPEAIPVAPASDLGEWLSLLFADKDLARMGHCQTSADLNLGMGWLYYGLTRLIRPQNVVVIGSWRGFSPLVFGRALKDNGAGKVTFIDPSLVDDFWKDPAKVQAHFARFGIENIEHHLMTTQQFVTSKAYLNLKEVGLVMIDGYHTEEQARIDFNAFVHRVPANGALLLHDSMGIATTRIYKDKPYERTVKRFVDILKQDAELQVFDLPYAEGLTLVRKVG